MGAKRTSTIGYEKKYNGALQISRRDRFIDSLTSDMPAAPDHFSRCSAINGKGPSLLAKLPVLKPLGATEFRRRAARKTNLVLDVRLFDSFGAQHVPGSYHIDMAGNFATFAGWILPPDREILLLAESGEQAQDAVTWLRRVGLDRVTGYLDGGMFAWASAGLPTDHVPQLSAKELHDMVSGKSHIIVADVRSPREYERTHIKGAVNIPFPELRTRSGELDPTLPIVVLCGSGQRSSLGASLLKQRGFQRVYNVSGGMTGYSAAGYAPECPVCVAPHLPRFPVR
jgi:rhodanese-related sulfurtransferase